MRRRPRDRSAELRALTNNADTYEIVVKFTRNFSEDLEVIENAPEYDKMTLEEALRIQFVKEIQAAYDHPDVSPAGSFLIIHGPALPLKQ